MSSSSTTRRRETRGRLVSAAHDLLAVAGHDACTVESVARQAGFSRGAFYSNYGSMDELLLAVNRECAGRVTRQWRLASVAAGAHARDQTPLAVLDRVLHAAPAIIDSSVVIAELRHLALRSPALASAHRALQMHCRELCSGLLRRQAGTASAASGLPWEAAAALVMDLWQQRVLEVVRENPRRDDHVDDVLGRLAPVLDLLQLRPTPEEGVRCPADGIAGAQR